MKKVIYNKIDKHAVTEMPRAVFEGRIFVITTERDADRAVEYLLTQPILGIDTETRPAFRKGKQYKVALLQVATYDTCFLFRLNNTGMTKSIIRLLEDESIPKIGLSLHDDIISLHKRAEFKPGNLIDLQKHVGEIGKNIFMHQAFNITSTTCPPNILLHEARILFVALEPPVANARGAV